MHWAGKSEASGITGFNRSVGSSRREFQRWLRESGGEHERSGDGERGGCEHRNERSDRPVVAHVDQSETDASHLQIESFGQRSPSRRWPKTPLVQWGTWRTVRSIAKNDPTNCFIQKKGTSPGTCLLPSRIFFFYTYTISWRFIQFWPSWGICDSDVSRLFSGLNFAAICSGICMSSVNEIVRSETESEHERREEKVPAQSDSGKIRAQSGCRLLILGVIFIYSIFGIWLWEQNSVTKRGNWHVALLRFVSQRSLLHFSVYPQNQPYTPLEGVPSFERSLHMYVPQLFLQILCFLLLFCALVVCAIMRSKDFRILF